MLDSNFVPGSQVELHKVHTSKHGTYTSPIMDVNGRADGVARARERGPGTYIVFALHQSYPHGVKQLGDYIYIDA
jgi:hypothetical protein